MISSHIFLPLFAAVTVICLFLCLPDLSACQLKSDAVEYTGKLKMRDWLTLFLITIAYAIVAFTNLGNTDSPQSFCVLSAGDEISLEIEENVKVNKIKFFPIANTGEYSVYASSDGIEYSLIGVINQDYISILKWNEYTIDEGYLTDNNISYIRLYPSSQLYLAEIALFSNHGEMVEFSSNHSEIYDEQYLVCASENYLNSSYFDEIYHARTAIEHIFDENPYEITHPPLGKLIIAMGIKLFGITPFGWRFSGTLLGVLMIPLIYIFAKILFGSYIVSVCTSILLSSEFMHFTQTRIATIDTYAVFFIMFMYLFMYLYITEEKIKWIALSGIFFGFGAASKWTCMYAGAGLAAIWGLHWLSAKKPFKEFVYNSLQCVLFFVIIPTFIYYISYFPYGRARGLHGIQSLFTKEYLNIVIDNQIYMFRYHSMLVAEHPYSSVWYQWLLDIRPILYYLEYGNNGSVSSISAFTNPLICWGGLISLFVLLFTSIFRKDKTAGFILIAYLAQLLPWVFVPRLTFAYHYFPCVIFLCISIGYTFNILCAEGEKYSLIPVYGFTIISVLLFILFYPVISGIPINAAFSDKYLGWLNTWPF